MYDEAMNVPALAHRLSLEGRGVLNIDGVEDVSGFDDSLVVLRTSQGELSIRGQQLHIERIDLESGVLQLKGHVQELSYDEPSEANGLWKRLFG